MSDVCVCMCVCVCVCDDVCMRVVICSVLVQIRVWFSVALISLYNYIPAHLVMQEILAGYFSWRY